MGDVPVLLSTERPRCSLVSLVDTAGADLRDYQVGGVRGLVTKYAHGAAPVVGGCHMLVEGVYRH
jgi:hypothetical protein